MAKKTDMKAFPDDFLWGASTASHQVEGGTVNQWSVWELAHASELAKSAPERLSGLPIWPDIRIAASDPANYVSGEGVDHYHRYREDFSLLQELNMNAFRFGIEWSRIEPEEGVWDERAIAHYKSYITELKSRGIEPFLNIWHWTNPIWFEDKGAFRKKRNLKYFSRYVQKIVKEFGSDIRYYLTINEPNSYAAFSYLVGQWPPGHRNIFTTMAVYMNLVRAHRISYRIIKARYPDAQVGCASQLTANLARRRNPLALVGSWFANYTWNWWYYNRCRKYQDFIGFNFYFTNYYDYLTFHNPKENLNDMGWYMEPSRLYETIMEAGKRYRLPMYVTESGVPDMHDGFRRWWMEETLEAMRRALEDGADLRGYFHWSLLDNFEWAYGWWPKFGLVEVDREHDMKRRVRPSARWFSQTIKRD